jgi:uncharacterized integral membrane protein
MTVEMKFTHIHGGHTMNNPSSPNVPPTYQGPRAQRRAERAARQAEHRTQHNGWIGGVILILLGGIFLLQNFGVVSAFNWWALFILIPAVGAFGAAWTAYRQTGRLGMSARGSLVGGIVLSMVAVAFLFNLNWALVGPALLILAGCGILVNVLLPK